MRSIRTGTQGDPGSATRLRPGMNLWSGILLGFGVIAFVDETVFHQLLHWHHFYDLSTTDVGIVSDGLFHAFSWFATIAALFLFAQLRRERVLHGRRFAGGFLVGAGFFQLYDGLIQHKLMGLHQIRYGVNIVPYDLTWNLIAAVLLAAGIWLIITTRSGAHSNHNRTTVPGAPPTRS
jgi:uncharacterized membrane protein